MNTNMSLRNRNKLVSIEEFYRTHFNELCFYAYSYIADIEASKDIVQEAFISLWVNREQYCLSRALLFTVVKNRAIDQLRKRNRNIQDSGLSEGALDEYIIELIASQEDLLAVKDLSNEISESICLLSPQCRRIFEMSRFRYMSNKEIAQELNISIKGVEKQITKALSVISTHLSKIGLFCLLLIFDFFS